VAAQIGTWQWLAASVAVPIAIGVGSAFAAHAFAVRKARLGLRFVDRREAYDVLLPALADVVAYDQRAPRFAYHGFGSQQSEDLARVADDEWEARHSAAMAAVRDVAARRELAAAPNVLAALDALLAEYSRIGSGISDDAIDWIEAHEMGAAASLAALDAVRKAVSREA
jgi:hypothetical protein